MPKRYLSTDLLENDQKNKLNFLYFFFIMVFSYEDFACVFQVDWAVLIHETDI